MSKLSDVIRVEWKKNDAIRDAGLTIPEGICCHTDIQYGADPVWQSLDVYYPEGTDEERPVIVSVHGGAWVYGDKNLYRFYCTSLATRGFAVVNFSYRLAPEHKFPAQLEDLTLVFGWMEAHGREYHFDMNHVFAVGDSAGAHLLGAFCNFCTNPEYAKHFTFSAHPSWVPKAVALNCGKYERDSDVIGGDREILEDLLPIVDEYCLDVVNVLKYVTEKFPPAYVMTCQGDFLKDQAPMMVERLLECDVPFQMEFYKSSTRELGHVFQVNMNWEEAHRCNDKECAFFRQFIEE